MAPAPKPDWFLQQWVRTLGKKQNDLVAELGWHKQKANRLWHGKQPFRRDDLNEVAEWLNLRPYEVLMHPDEAMAIRRLRESAATIVSGLQPLQADNLPSNVRPLTRSAS